MKRNITPFYIDGPVESVDCSSGNQTISGKSSFVLVAGPSSGTPVTLSLPVRTSDDRPIVPGTMVTMVRTDSDSVAVNVTSESALDTNSSSTLSAYLDSTSFMFVGPNNNNIFGSWTLISSDLATADWNGGNVTEETTFSGNVSLNASTFVSGIVYLNGTTTHVGNDSADLLKISSKAYYTNRNNDTHKPTLTVSSINGTATINANSSQNAGVIEFSTGWANGESLQLSFPQSFPSGSYVMIFTNKDTTVNGSITTIDIDGFTFIASGNCTGNLEYFVVATGQG